MADVELNTLIDTALLQTTTGSLTGSGFLKFNGTTLEWVDESNIHGGAFGEMRIENNTTTLALSPVDPSIDANYVKVDSSLWTTGQLSNMGFTTSVLNIQKDGIYQISFWASFFVSAAANTDVYFKFSINDSTTGLSPRSVQRTSDAAGDIGSITATGVTQALVAGDTLSLWVAADTTCNLTVMDAGLHAILLQGA